VRPAVLALPGDEDLAAALVAALGAEDAALELRAFPDGETHVHVGGAVAGRDVVLACSLHDANVRTVPLLLAAATARDLGASRVGLVAPYLPYLRQDARFTSGEGVTARYYPRFLAGAFDWVVTVDPHLHRLPSLDAVYPIPAAAVHAAAAIAAWLRSAVPDGVVIGPDAESAQWVADVAARAGLPMTVLQKVRRGDRAVSVSTPDLARWSGRTPVLVDDIISTAQTMIAAVGHLRAQGSPPPVCVGIHALLCGRAEEDLRAAGAARIVTCNTIPHATNAIDVRPMLTAAVGAMLARPIGGG
jgi:ribose-phosphate pyrophosphokinase